MTSSSSFPRKIPDSLLRAFSAAFTQRNRLIALRFPDGAKDIEQGELLPASLYLTSALSDDTNIELLCLTANSHLELKTYLGQPAELSIQLADGKYRYLSGVVLEIADQGLYGAFTKVMLTIVPVFQTLKYRRTCRVFQSRSVPDIVETIFAEHRAKNPVFTLCLDVTNNLLGNRH